MHLLNMLVMKTVHLSAFIVDFKLDSITMLSIWISY